MSSLFLQQGCGVTPEKLLLGCRAGQQLWVLFPAHARIPS